LSLTLALDGLSAAQINPVRLEADEGLSEPFHFTLDLLTEEEFDILPNIGKPAVIEGKLEGEHVRYFHGLVTSGHFIQELDGIGFLYQMEIVPKAEFHRRGRNFRIFQEKTVKDIICTILDECGIDYEFRTKNPSRMRTYCVQYGESNFDFVSRLMEEEGFYYFYEHTASLHKLVICFASNDHKSLEFPDVTYSTTSASTQVVDTQSAEYTSAGIFLNSWLERVQSYGEDKVTMEDYNFIDPNEELKVENKEAHKHKGDSIEVYEWPGRYYASGEGKDLAKTILEARRALRVTYEASGHYPGFIPGFKFKLKSHPISRYNAEHLIVRCHTSMATEQYRSGLGEGQTSIYLTAMPFTETFKAPLVTPRPVVTGPETAVVTGPKGEEIYVDKYGRIKVQFHWDREGKKDDKSSCWLRVSQTGHLGNMIIPRIDHEVLVDFINGNPDRPIVVGRLYNNEDMPTYELPKHKTRALWRSKTYQKTKGVDHGAAKDLGVDKTGANEFRYEDKTGEEELFVHAEKDMNVEIRYNETRKTENNVKIEVGGSREELVCGNETIKIEGDRKEEVLGTETIDITGDREVTIKANDTLDVTQKIYIKAGMEIKLEVGTSSITMTPEKIAIKTTMLEMQGTATAKLNSAMTNVEASAMLTAKGGMVMIN
jgi:type VI secretion system secreted protein VgrG